MVVYSSSLLFLLLQICPFAMVSKLLNGCACLRINGKLLPFFQVVDTIANLVYDLTG